MNEKSGMKTVFAGIALTVAVSPAVHSLMIKKHVVEKLATEDSVWHSEIGHSLIVFEHARNDEEVLILAGNAVCNPRVKVCED